MITIVDYKAGNLTSVRLALEKLACPAVVTDRPEAVRRAERVIFPGVGAAGAAMRALRERGLVEALRETVRRGVPFLGICLGTQILLDRSEEDGGTDGLGIVPGTVRLFRPPAPTVKVPQIGWNQVRFTRPHPLFEGIGDGSEFYFVHSYYPAPADRSFVLGETDYAGARFASIVGRGTFAAVQFHPERSGRVGLRLLENFVRWDGREGA